MKVFQILNEFVYYDATPLYPTAEEAAKHYAPDIVFVDAPDYVFEGWGFDESAEGDARFIKPTPPPGWGYDDETGTFYPLNPPPLTTPVMRSPGEVWEQDGTMYKALLQIPAGGALALGTNCVKTTLLDEINNN